MAIRLRLRELLEERGTNPHALARQITGHDRGSPMYYKLVSTPMATAKLATIDQIMVAVEALSGRPVTFEDILERVPDPARPDDEDNVPLTPEQMGDLDYSDELVDDPIDPDPTPAPTPSQTAVSTPRPASKPRASRAR